MDKGFNQADDFIAYAEHCAQMAESSESQQDKALWLRMEAAWRRKAVDGCNRGAAAAKTN